MRWWWRIAVAAGMALGWTVAAQSPTPTAPLFRSLVRVPMRDGVYLSGHVWRASTASRLPVLLIRTPYGKGEELHRNYRILADHGYAIVIQDVRGRHASGGIFDPLRQEIEDGDDTLRWIARQPWSNGKIGMTGGSYLGIAQWKAALSGNPNLKAIAPVVSGGDDYLDRFYSPGGAMKLGHRISWLAANMRRSGFQGPRFDQYIWYLPLRSADRVATGATNPLFQQAIAHPAYDSYWRSLSTLDRIEEVQVPVFSVGGWYDNYVESDLAAFAALRRLGRTVRTIIGPWPHNMSMRFTSLDFGPQAMAPIIDYQLQWFDRWVKGEPPPDDGEEFAPLRIFVMGINQWRDEQDWPLERAVPTPFYLSAGAQLALQAPRKEGVERYVYDPSKPVPTRGGSVCCNPKIFPWGPMDQSPLGRRRDILEYTTPVLDRDIEVTGPIVTVLEVATSARDTDFTAKLMDVHPDGRAFNLTDGILRLRYRDGLDRPQMAEPGKRYTIRIPTGVTSNVFKAGHRIRLAISSSNFPRFDRNLNTGGDNASSSRWAVARQTVYLGKSYVELPVVPASARSTVQAVKAGGRRRGR